MPIAVLIKRELVQRTSSHLLWFAITISAVFNALLISNSDLFENLLTAHSQEISIYSNDLTFLSNFDTALEKLPANKLLQDSDFSIHYLDELIDSTSDRIEVITRETHIEITLYGSSVFVKDKASAIAILVSQYFTQDQVQFQKKVIKKNTNSISSISTILTALSLFFLLMNVSIYSMSQSVWEERITSILHIHLQYVGFKNYIIGKILSAAILLLMYGLSWLVVFTATCLYLHTENGLSLSLISLLIAFPTSLLLAIASVLIALYSSSDVELQAYQYALSIGATIGMSLEYALINTSIHIPYWMLSTPPFTVLSHSLILPLHGVKIQSIVIACLLTTTTWLLLLYKFYNVVLNKTLKGM